MKVPKHLSNQMACTNHISDQHVNSYIVFIYG